MPLFFFLGGFLLSTKPFSIFLKKKTQHLIIPYVKYLLFFMLLTILITFKKHELSINSFSSILFSSIYGGQYLTGWIGVFWFTTVFYFSQQILNNAINTLGEKITGAIALIFLLCAYLVPWENFPPSPLNIFVVFYSMPIMYLGFMYKKHMPHCHKSVFYIISAIGIAVYFLLPNAMKVDMKTCTYGIPVIGLVTAIAMSICVFDLSKKIKSKVIVFFGINSMSIMYIHQFIHLTFAEKVTGNILLALIITPLLSAAYCIFFKKAMSLTFRKIDI